MRTRNGVMGRLPLCLAGLLVPSGALESSWLQEGQPVSVIACVPLLHLAEVHCHNVVVLWWVWIRLLLWELPW